MKSGRAVRVSSATAGGLALTIVPGRLGSLGGPDWPESPRNGRIALGAAASHCLE
jgi:hypothetical protein